MKLKDLYTEDDIKSMKLANDARLPGKNRVEEIRNYAKIAGIKRIGIANCVAVQKEADAVIDMLSTDLEVFSVDCKYNRIASSEFVGQEAKGVSCNPSGQAAYLAENSTELNIVMGLCVGHDMIFAAKSKVPSTTLVVKDREFKHNPIEAFSQNS